MGNTHATEGSNRPSADQLIVDNAKTEGDEEAELEESGLDLGSDTDFSHLFNVNDLHFIASNLSVAFSDVEKTVYERCYQELKERLENMENQTDVQMMNFTRFCDMLKSLKLSHAELTQVFNLLDHEGRGSFEIAPVLKELRKNKKIMLNDDLNSVLKRFEDCSWMPGFLDVYIHRQDCFKQHGLSILEYLIRNRFSSYSASCETIELFEVACKIREKIVKSRMKSLEIPSHEDGAGLQSSTSLTAQTEPVLKKEGSVSGEDLLPEEVKKQKLQQDKLHASEVLVLWYTQLVTTTARACLSLAPELMNTALNHTRTMVDQLLPLSLSHDSEERPSSFLNSDCLREMGSLIQLCPEKPELLAQSLSFHLACGSVSEILHCLTELNVSTVQIDCSNLVSNMDQVTRRLLDTDARYLKVDLLGCDAEGSTNQDPLSVLEPNWKQSDKSTFSFALCSFTTKPGETKVNFVFESSKWAEFTKIRIKVGAEKSAPRRGFIFVLTKWHVDADSSLKKELEKFSIYDNWTDSEFKSRNLNRLTEGPVAYFSTTGRDEVDIVFDRPVSGKFIVVKFLEPRETGVDHLGIVGIKFYGVQITASYSLLMRHSLSIDRPLESNQMVIQTVLRFLILVFHCQTKNKQAVAEDIYNFRRQTYFKVDQKSGFVVYDPPEYEYAPIVLAKLPFSKHYPYFEIELFSNGDRGGAVCIGAATKGLGIDDYPGGDSHFYVYHSASGSMLVDEMPSYTRRASRCKTGDRMGCGVEFEGNKIKRIYFTKNGVRVCHFEPDTANAPAELFPTINMALVGDKVRLLNKESWRFSDKPVEKVRGVAAPGSDFIIPNHLDLSNVSFELLWETYKTFPEKMDQSLFLQLINSMLPHLVLDSNSFKLNTSEILTDLCYLSDHKNEIEGEDDIVSRSAQDIIRDGLDLFFPCKEARPKMLLDLLQESTELSLIGSKQILFQSLCHYFSTADLNILMPLPTKPSLLSEDLNSIDLFTIIGKFLSISFHDSLGLFQLTPKSDGSTVIRRSVSGGDETLSGRKKSEHLFHLSKLLNQLQVRLFAWVFQELSKPPEATEDVDRLENIIIHYCCQLIIPKAEHFLARMKLLKDPDLRAILHELDTSFLATTLRELVLLLLELATKLSSRYKLKLLENLKPLMMTIRKLLMRLPDLLPSLDENLGDMQMEKQLRTWEVDSPLTNRPSNICLKFSCVGATHFEVEFDKRCETEVSYETLTFADSKGDGRVFSGQVGHYNWPINVRFEGTSVIDFTYKREIPDVSTAGYNFKVKAMQTKVSDFHWLYDIYLSFCRLFGRISASVLDKTPVLPNSASSQDKLEMQMYRSELWTTIFRGGLVAKKFERSLSGSYETVDQSDVATFLNAVAEFKSEKAKTFINRCKCYHHGNHSIGGEEVDRAIASVFSALLWHTQSLRHDVNVYLRNEFDDKISDGIHEAYAAAENHRLFLAEKRQTMRKELEERRERGEEEEEKEKEVAVDVVHFVEEKSKFLLQFAGLAKVALKAEEFKRKLETRRSVQRSISHRLSHESSVDLSISVESKYPSFRLVFDFVQDIAWTKDKVQDLLKKRYVNSECLWKTYSFMGEFFRTFSSEHLENDMSCTVFLRELLTSQHQFGHHYADGIDGCGLGMEANVRSSYYGLMRHLVALLRRDMTSSSDKSKPVGFEVLATCVLHLLDIDWQAYDLPFMVEFRLPELYFTLAKEYLQPVSEESEEFGVDETEEEYRRNLQWAEEAHADGCNYLVTRSVGADVWLAKHIKARFHRLRLGTSFHCGACRDFVITNYYRCLDCHDVDICVKCYESEAHNGDHSLVLFRYLCKGCTGFIIATRWHCNECNDFDLCNGCHNCNNFPAGSSHNVDHSISKFPTPRVHLNQKVTFKNPMGTYFHLHSWMLFCSTALSTLDFLMNKSSEEKVQRTNENYLCSARQLYSVCLETAVEYLIHEMSTDEVDSEQSTTSTEANATQANSSNEALEHNEGTLVSKIIGLISALIPPNNQNPAVREVTEILSSEKFLMALFDIASAKKMHGVVTRHMALGLLGKLLQQMNTSSEASQSLKSSESGEVMIVDPKAVNLVQSLFSFGADCLKRHGLELAKSTSEVLNGLQTNPTWTQLLAHQFTLTVDLVHLSPSLSSIFALFAFTGFPEVLTVGTLVTHVEKDNEVIHSVVRSKKSDEEMCTILELTSRMKKRMKCTLLDVVASNKSFLTDSQVSQFMKLIIETVNQKVIPGLAVNALSLWQLALVIKATVQFVHNSQSRVNLQLYENSFLQSISHLASQGTHLSKSILLRDLEILSLELNKRSQTEPDLAAEPEVTTDAGEGKAGEDMAGEEKAGEDAAEKDTAIEEKSGENAARDNTTGENTIGEDKAGDDNAGEDKAGEEKPLDSVNNVGKDGNVSVASSFYEDEDDPESRRQSVESGVRRQHIDLQPASMADEILIDQISFPINREEELSEEAMEDSVVEDAESVKEERLKTMHKKGEIEIGSCISDLLHAEIEIDECIEEANLEKPCMISTSRHEDKEMAEKRKRRRDHLVKKLLTSKEKGLLTKVNRALAILYARKLLMALVSECPDDRAVEFFRAGDPSNITSIFLLSPLLVGLESDRILEKVITKVINCCPPNEVVSIAVASSFFVAATVGQEATVSKHLPPLSKSGENIDSSSSDFMDEVYFPGAAALKVELDKRTFAACDEELVFSSSPDLTKNRQCFSGRSAENWKNVTIKGDHLYCSVVGPAVGLLQSSYQFKVTGIVSFADHFDVGYLALSAIFDKPETAKSLPFGRLWKLLVGTVNHSAKTQRLKAIRLLIKLLSLQTKSLGCDELPVDLSLLKGLWQIYQKMMETTTDSTEVLPSLVLALTELFFVAQNVAKEWNAVQSFMASEESDGSTSQE